MLIEWGIGTIEYFAAVINQPVTTAVDTKNGVCRFYPLSRLAEAITVDIKSWHALLLQAFKIGADGTR